MCSPSSSSTTSAGSSAERLSAQYGVGKDQVDQLITVVEAQLRTVDARVKVLETQFDGLLDSCRTACPSRRARCSPGPARPRADARKAATEAGEKLTSLVRDAAA